jgi:hypothetical protein
MPDKCIYKSVSELCSGQKGAASPATILFLIGIIVVGMVVVYAVFGTTLFSANAASMSTDANQAAYKPGPGAFTPIADIANSQTQNHERAFSTVKGAIADLNNTSTDNMSLNEQYNRK